MRTVRGVGLLAGVLSLVSGLAVLINYVWVFTLIIAGFWHEASWPLAAPLWFLILNAVVYFPLSVGMILDRRKDFFLYAAVWAVVASALAVFLGSFIGSLLSLLYFLIVFSSTYYYVRETSTRASTQIRMLAGVLALVQGAYLALVFFIVSLLALSQARNPLAGAGIANPLGVSLAAGMVIYFMLGAGIIKGRREFLLYAVLATILESALAVLTGFFARDGFYNLLSILTLFLSTLCYWAERKA